MAVRHPITLAILLAAFTATAAVFLLARPQYRPPDYGGRQISGARFPAPAHGWTWADGQPGFRFGEDEQDWNFSRLTSAELAGARAAAAQAGVAPRSIRTLSALRFSPQDLFAFVAGSDSEGRTCLGAVLPKTPISFSCPGSAGSHRLGPQVAFVMVAALPSMKTKTGNGHGFTHYDNFPLLVLGVVRADVRRVVLKGPTLSDTFSPQAEGWWGTFTASPGDGYVSGRVPKHPWRAQLDFYGDRGLLARLPIRIGRPTAELVVVPARHSIERPSNE